MRITTIVKHDIQETIRLSILVYIKYNRDQSHNDLIKIHRLSINYNKNNLVGWLVSTDYIYTVYTVKHHRRGQLVKYIPIKKHRSI